MRTENAVKNGKTEWRAVLQSEYWGQRGTTHENGGEGIPATVSSRASR